MSDLLDPEEVKEITSSIFDGVRRIVKKYSGVIERFEGDGFLALFGTPRAHDDDPVRAIRAAKEIHRFVEQDISPRYESLLGSALSMHSGINTGLAVTADLDPEKGTNGVTGLSINIAARLCDLAAPGEILVGINTQEVSKHHFLFKALGPKKIKGTTDRVPIFSLMSKCLSKASDRNRRKVSFQMIGRNQELVTLEGRLSKLLDGEGSVVTIIGEAGIGKSRLMAELKKVGMHFTQPATRCRMLPWASKGILLLALIILEPSRNLMNGLTAKMLALNISQSFDGQKAIFAQVAEKKLMLLL
jgi:class 3 adenylate cyclase